MTRWRIALLLFLLPVFLVVLYLLLAFIGARIPVNADYRQPDVGIPVYLQSNGAHIDLIFPVSVNCRCGRDKAPRYDVLEHAFDMTAPTAEWQWLAAGWGDQQFMLNVATWNDLTANVALKAVTGMDGSVVRLSAYHEPRSGEGVSRLLVTQEQYVRLLRHIRASLGVHPEEVAASIASPEDRFYRSRDTYHLFNTCNEWVRETVEQAGIRTAWWTPFDAALLSHFGR